MSSKAGKGNKKPVAKEKSASTGPRSLTRVLGLFDILAESPDGRTLADLSEALSSPKSSLLNLFRPLVEDGFLSHVAGHYRLGPSIYRLSAKIISTWNFSSIVHPFVEELARETGESVYLGVLDMDMQVITYVDAIDSRRSIRYPITVGTSRPLYCTAAGRILLAYCEDTDWVEDYLKNVQIERRTKDTITDRRQLRKCLKDIRESGISVSIGELWEELGAVASPVFGADGRILAALAVGGPVETIQGELPKLQELLTSAARRASGTVNR